MAMLLRNAQRCRDVNVVASWRAMCLDQRCWIQTVLSAVWLQRCSETNRPQHRRQERTNPLGNDELLIRHVLKRRDYARIAYAIGIGAARPTTAAVQANLPALVS